VLHRPDENVQVFFTFVILTGMAHCSPSYGIFKTIVLGVLSDLKLKLRYFSVMLWNYFERIMPRCCRHTQMSTRVSLNVLCMKNIL
jgi:hypothetical protein